MMLLTCLKDFFQDLKFGLRILLRAPAMACAVILALALGIGADSAMFSVVDALLLNQLPYRDPASLAIVWDKDAQGTTWSASPANFIDWRDRAKAFEGFAGWMPASYVRTGVEPPEQLFGAAVTANFFQLLGVKPAMGRTFLLDEDGLSGGGARKVAVISNRMWRDNLGADPNVLGRELKLNSAVFTVIGVMPASFQFIARHHQVWTPASLNRQNRDFHSLTVVGRIAKGSSRERATSEMTALARALAETYPKSNKGWSIEVDDFQDWLINRKFKTRLVLLFAAVGLVLLIACSNVASLLLARASGRSREIAVRVSLGATAGRVVRQLLTESLILSLAGGASGLALAWQLIRMAPRFVPPNVIPASAPIELNTSVVLFTLGISLLTGVLFGLAPALAAAKPDVQDTLKDSSRGSSPSAARQRFRQAMVVAEVAVALMLVASAVLMMESFHLLTSTELGFNPKNAMSVRVFLPPGKYDPAHALAFHQRAIEKLAQIPGVRSVALGTSLPLQRGVMGAPFDLETTSPPREQAERPDVSYITVSPEYFKSLGILVMRGRAFADADNEIAPPVVIVNQAFADRYFEGQNPVGKRILLDRPKLPSGFENTIHPEIVGVVANVKTVDLASPCEPILYAPHAQNIWSPAVFFTLRSSMNSTELAGAVRKVLQSLDPEQPLSQMGSLEQTLAVRAAEPKFQTQMMGAFAGLALLLAVVGIYGVNAYAVAQRRHEIGVKMALGATQGMVMREMIGQGMRVTGVGIVLGILGALASASLLRSVLVDVSPTDPLTLGGVALALALASVLACYVPARRATRVDPALALRGN